MREGAAFCHCAEVARLKPCSSRSLRTCSASKALDEGGDCAVKKSCSLARIV
jgi:hypothetical protein